MSWIQRVVLRLSGGSAAAIERETRCWVATCPECGNQQSYWDLGAIRYGASSSGKKIRVACPQCGTTAMNQVSRLPEEPTA